MTDRKDKKCIIRERMMRTGEKYNVARRKVEQRAAEQAVAPPPKYCVGTFDALGGSLARAFLFDGPRFAGGAFGVGEEGAMFFGPKDATILETPVLSVLRDRASPSARKKAGSLAQAIRDAVRADFGIAAIESEAEDEAHFLMAVAGPTSARVLCVGLKHSSALSNGEVAQFVAPDLLARFAAGQTLRKPTIEVDLKLPPPRKSELGALIGQIVAVRSDAIRHREKTVRIQFQRGTPLAEVRLPQFPLVEFQCGDFVEVAVDRNQAIVTALQTDFVYDCHERPDLRILERGRSVHSPVLWIPVVATN